MQVLPSDIAQITNTCNDDILCHAREKWWEELGATEEEVAEILIGNRSINVRDIQTSHLLVLFRAMYSVVQHTVLLRSGNTDVMIEVA